MGGPIIRTQQGVDWITALCSYLRKGDSIIGVSQILSFTLVSHSILHQNNTSIRKIVKVSDHQHCIHREADKSLNLYIGGFHPRVAFIV